MRQQGQFVLHLVLVTGLLIQACEGSKWEDRLFSKLLMRYNRLSRPVSRNGDTLRLHLGVSLREAISLNEDLGQVAVLLWLKMVWRDNYLRWKPSDFGGIEQIYIPSNKVWTPDITLYNALHTEPDDTQNHLKLIVNYDGEITWVRPVTYSVTCKHEFRGNAWVCPFTFGSWVYNAKQLDLVADSEREHNKVQMDDGDFLSSDHFILLGHEGRRDVKKYNPDSFVSLTYVIKLRNKIGPALFGRK